MNQDTDSIKGELERLAIDGRGRVEAATGLKDLESVKLDYLGRKDGSLTRVLRGLASLSPDDRREIGRLANVVKADLEAAIEAREADVRAREQEERLQRERIDVTLPSRMTRTGHLHPITLIMRRIKQVFIGLGFEVVTGPEVETDYYNFEALNMGADHPAREMWDSFFLGGNLLLRSHTSPVQGRIMEQQAPPVRVIVPGKCYRRDAVDATHCWQFHQVEGLLVDEGVSFADLKGVLDAFAREMFGQQRRTRFAPGYFPFTEPSAEMYIDCFACEGAGCRICKHSGWIEILGSGVVHPSVLEKVGYDPERYTGFAFGMGVERIAMLRHGIDDIRLFYENDLRFLEQF